MQQQALFHGSGEFSALVLLSANANDAGESLLIPAMTLMALARLSQQPNSGFPPNLYILVALHPNLSPQKGVREPLPKPFIDDPGHVLVQISATTAADRALALRLVTDCFGDIAEARSIQGARLFTGQENFGFRDGGVLTPSDVSTRLDGNADGTWLLFQRIQQNVRNFMQLTPTQKVDVVGRPLGNTLGRPPVTPRELTDRANLVAQAQNPGRVPNSHYWVMQGQGSPIPMVRRGFAYQDVGDEGLAFVAASSNPQVLSQALNLMVQGGDKLMNYITPREGGVYFCPSLNWINQTVGALPQVVDSLRHNTRLISYTTTEAFILWMLELRNRNVFVPGPPGHRAVLDPALQAHMDALYQNLSGAGTPTQKVATLKAFQQQAEQDAGDINETLDEYLTFN